MANIDTEIAAIQKAIYGEEVRGSIVDALTAVSNESKGASDDAESAKALNASAKAIADQATSTLTSAQSVLSQAQAAIASTQEIVDQTEEIVNTEVIGFSPKVTMTSTDTGATITIEDRTGTQSVDLLNGQKGDAGVYHGVVKHTMGSNDTSVTLNPNEVYIFPTMSSLTITLGTSTSYFDEYHFFFTSGATATTLTLPSGISLPAGFSVVANKKYEISIAQDIMIAVSR